MSFQEKSAIAMTGALAVVYGVYLAIVGRWLTVGVFAGLVLAMAELVEGATRVGALPAGRLTVAKPTRVTNQIRTLRLHAGQMTQGELADRIGITRQTLNAIEQGKYSPSLEVAFRIARVFAVPLEQVFQYPERGRQ